MISTRLDPRSPEARQQPVWGSEAALQRVRDELRHAPGLVRSTDVRLLRMLLARVAAGEALIVQAGDCAEDPAECTERHVAGKVELLASLAGELTRVTGKPVLRVGRIAGQFAKPRSSDTETVDGVELPVYRGHLVNSPERDREAREANPRRLVDGYRASRHAMDHLGWNSPDRLSVDLTERVWTSHEALLLDYETPSLRMDAHGRRLLTSTHWPWIGERTRQADGAHVALLSDVVNPVSVKIGPAVTPAELMVLLARLDPAGEPGRLTLIARMGADAVAERLPALVKTARMAGHPVIWQCDPMHANTVTAPGGFKTRYVETIMREVEGFQAAVREGGGVAGGLHLETTPDDVTECVENKSQAGLAGERRTTLCDPRLTAAQALSVVGTWKA
ncbi:3-deoxy-D-arabinoheptulosonate-7-phosphate synthase [Amycolatopsis xylanica]|uniref:Phospho-2-dehydro-3-deoxyheptonate aldolase n=1 Tax=Amycolatopsis xylanica TaxID=589385 RepID=A0A1H3P4D0_9PSEU|nr:3-deoxy-7-phosphoheptulonate synthase [Amycolatopsis xylanica]SDY95928.1 3-deoxy-D-arabinoheptulosonate-7-phosphate synthase [Amycolatopsis xylanica]